jgi:N-acetylglucosamine-6-phosphate deacetylase
VEDVIGGVNFHLTHGTTTVYPTVSAAPLKEMGVSAGYIREAAKDPRTLANIGGAHLEGPYLSTRQCGAQSADFITAPKAEDYVPLFEEYGDVIARVTYAPEEDEDCAFAKFLQARGVVSSAGHTDAGYHHMEAAMQAGCRLVTHLYSCTSTVTRKQGFRILGVIETALLRDDLYAEIIADGKHLPPDLIRLILKAKGTDRVILITDSLAPAGTNVKSGRMQATDFIIEDGVCKLPDRSAFAGSIATADRLIRVLTGEVGLPMWESVKMLTAIPAEMMGLNKGEIAPGRDADLLIFDGNVNIKKVFVNGVLRIDV